MSEWREDEKVSGKKLTGDAAKSARVRLTFSDDTPLGTAREAMLQHISGPGGVYCPCCGSINKVYARGVHWKSGVWLCQLVRRYLTEQRWYQVQEFYDIRGGDYAKLRYWGLAELRPTTDYDTRTSGMWRPTEKGVLFARGRIKIPEKVLLYQSKYMGVPEGVKDISIHQVLTGSEGRFSWSETMAEVAEVEGVR